MSDQVTFDNLGLKLSELLDESSYLVKEAARDILKTYAEKIRSDIPATTAFEDGNHKIHLRNAFEVKETLDETNNVAFVIQAGTEGHKYSVVHLVELGHRMIVNQKTKGGTKKKVVLQNSVPPHPFLNPLVDIYAPIIHTEVAKAIQEALGKASVKQ